MTIQKFSFLFFLLLSATFASCDDARTAGEQLDNATEDVSDEFRTETEELNAELRNARRSIDQRLDALENDLENASDDARAEINETMRELRDYGNDIDDRMDKIGKDANNGWQAFKQETQATLRKIEAEIEN